MPVVMPKFKFGKVTEILLWVTALAVLAQNVVLLRQNKSLREATAPQIAGGAQLQMLSALALDGRVEPVNLPSAGSKLLIITFSPGCPACQANLEGWMKVANALKQNGMGVLWMSRDPVDITREYCLKHGIPLIDVVADPPYRTYLQLGLARVPNTVFVDSSGAVEKVWAGQLDNAGWDAIFTYFGGRRESTSATRSALGTATNGCGSELSGASAKNCK